MKALKRSFAALLTAALLFTTACSGGTNGSSSGGGASGNSLSVGRYVERTITPPGAEGELALFKKADGTLVCYSDEYAKRWESADGGETWGEKPGVPLGDEIGMVYSATLTPEGDLIASIVTTQDRENARYTQRLMRIDENGNATPVSLDAYDELLENGESPSIYTLEALPGGQLLMNYYWGMDYGYSLGGETETPEDEDDGPEEDPATAEPEEATENGDAGTGQIVTSGMGNDILAIFDLATGQQVAELQEFWPSAVATAGSDAYLLEYGGIVYKLLPTGGTEDGGSFTPGSSFSYNTGLAADEAGNLYYIDSTGLQRLPTEGEEAETLLSGGAYSFGSPSAVITGLEALVDGSLVLSLTENGENSLLKYEWDPDATLDPNKTLSVWSLYNDPTVRAAISNLRRNDPEVTVDYYVAIPNVQEMSPDEKNTAISDAVKTLNTEILAGKGPDVIVLDDTPLESYAAQGLLEDLSAYIDSSNVYSSLLSSFGTDSKLYALPTRFKLPTLVGPADGIGNVSTLEDLVALAESLPARDANIKDGDFGALPEEERPAFGFTSLDELFEVLWAACGGDIVTGNTLDTEALSQFLSTLGKLSDYYNLARTDDAEESNSVMAVFSSDGASTSSLTGGALNYLMERSAYATYTADDMMILRYLFELEGTEIANLPGITENSWVPASMVGINEGSSVKELATAFINAMLSDEVQKLRGNGGFPVTKTGMKAQIDAIDEIYREMAEEMTKMGMETEFVPFSVDMDALAMGLGTPNLGDEELKNKIYNAALALCRGEKDLETTVTNIEQETKNYLAERQ